MLATARAYLRKRFGPDVERGQVLIVFLAVFSVFLILGAFAIDQGLFQDSRRTSQKDADLAARAGASVYLRSISDGELVPSAATQSQAAARSLQYTTANGEAAAAPTVTTSVDCPQAYGGTITGAPSVSVVGARTQGGLFSNIFGTKSLGTSAGSTACVGAAQKISVDSHEGLPVADYNNDTTENSCWAPAVPPATEPSIRIGMQCVIKHGSDSAASRGYFQVPPDDQCSGRGGLPDTDQIQNGINFTCQISLDTSTCDPLLPDCIKSINAVGGRNIPSDFNARLTRPDNNDCASGAFSDIFDYADGRPGPVKGPPGLNSPVNDVSGSADPPDTVYVQKPCASPRTALIILSTDNDGDTTNPVVGFAAIYIVGCFDERDTEPDGPLSNVINNCDTVYNASKEGHIEIRGIIVHAFFTNISVGTIGTITDSTSVLAIQTTK